MSTIQSAEGLAVTPDAFGSRDHARPAVPPPLVPAVTAEAAGRWYPRLSRWVLRAVVVIAVAVCIGAALSPPGVDLLGRTEGDEPVTAAVVESPRWFVDAVVTSAVLTSLAVVFLAPAAGTVLATLGMFVIAASLDDAAGEQALWLGAAAVVAAVGSVDALASARQRRLARAWSTGPTATVLVPDVSPGVRASLLRHRAGRLLATVACLAVGLGGWGLYLRDAAAASAFRSGAVVASATVETVSQDATGVMVAVGARRLNVPSPTKYPKEGDVVEVRYEMASGRAELTDDVFDPTLALLPGVAGLVTGAVLLGAELRRRRRLVALLDEGGAAVRMRATWSERHRRAALYPYDSLTGAVATAPDLVGDLPEDLARPDGNADEDAWDEDAWDDDAWDDESDGDPVLDDDVDVSRIGDAELLRMARDLPHGQSVDGEDEALPPRATPRWGAAPVVVVGFERRGTPVAIQGPEGTWYVTCTGLTAPPRGRQTSIGSRSASGLRGSGRSVAGAVLVCLGVLVAAMSAFGLWYEIDLVRSGGRTLGTVVAVETDVKLAIVEYAVDDVEYMLADAIIPGNKRVGDQVVVLYDPSDPGFGIVEGDRFGQALAIVGIVAGAILGAAGTGLLITAARRRPRIVEH